MDKNNWQFDTIAVQGAYEPKNGESRVMPLALSTTFARYDHSRLTTMRRMTEK